MKVIFLFLLLISLGCTQRSIVKKKYNIKNIVKVHRDINPSVNYPKHIPEEFLWPEQYRDFSVEEIIELITQLIEPDSWDDAESNIQIFQENFGVLTIQHTKKAHEKIKYLISKVIENPSKKSWENILLKKDEIVKYIADEQNK